jgi:diaminohydroxyphosphoribosylaminopyrimidine deaminase/5-amino-6-(5-phosphoribosylamino)uracil reductase
MITDFDRFAMNRALVLAARGLETTHPNPRVGCVVAQGTKIIGEGWHERAGEARLWKPFVPPACSLREPPCM